MSTFFYDHIVIREEIEYVLNSYRLDSAEKDELIEIIDSTLSHHVLNVILSLLPKDKHIEFMSGFRDNPSSDTHLEYLKNHAHPEIEKEIKNQIRKVKSDIISEIHKSRAPKRRK